jgi:hypothetical protein
MLVKAVDGTPLESLTKGSSRKVVVKCDDCGREDETHYHNYVKSQTKKGNTGQTTCRSCIMKKQERLTGNQSRRWSGGEKVNKSGRVSVYHSSSDGKTKYVHRAVKVFESHYGRPVNKGELVHHIDGDPSNDAPENLTVLGVSKHHVAHRELEKISMRLFAVGLVVFDREKMTYKASDKLLAIMEARRAR